MPPTAAAPRLVRLAEQHLVCAVAPGVVSRLEGNDFGEWCALLYGAAEFIAREPDRCASRRSPLGESFKVLVVKNVGSIAAVVGAVLAREAHQLRP